MADRQTALAVFDFLDSLRAGQYRIGADAEKDHATAGLLASLSGDTGLRDAVCAKLISPGLERARFLMVAEHDPRALPLFASGQVKPWYQADYNVREIANSEFHQDIPALLWRLSNSIPDSARREGMLEAAAYMSFMQGDPEAAFTGHLGRLAAVSPEGEVTRCLMDAHEHGQHPAWVMEQRQLRERQADAADGMPSTRHENRNRNAGHRPNPNPSPGPGWSRMRDAWTTPEAKAGRTRPSIRGRSARCHRPRIRWGMISRPMPRHRNRSTLAVPWSRPISPTRSTSRRSATGMPPCPCANGGA